MFHCQGSQMKTKKASNQEGHEDTWKEAGEQTAALIDKSGKGDVFMPDVQLHMHDTLQIRGGTLPTTQFSHQG